MTTQTQIHTNKTPRAEKTKRKNSLVLKKVSNKTVASTLITNQFG